MCEYYHGYINKNANVIVAQYVTNLLRNDYLITIFKAWSYQI